MPTPQDWKQRIDEITAKRSHDAREAAETSGRRHAYLQGQLAEFERRLIDELDTFSGSEEARFMQRELGRPGSWVHDGWVPANFGREPSKVYHPPPNVLRLFDLRVHKDDSRVFAFSWYGLSEFYRSVSFWIGLGVPARGWAFGDGMSGRRLSAAGFASRYMQHCFPRGPDSLTIRLGAGQDDVAAMAAGWAAIPFDEWVRRLSLHGESRPGVADSIRSAFARYVETR